MEDIHRCVLTCDETGELGAGALRDSQVRWGLSELRFTLKLQLQRLHCLLRLYNNKVQEKVLLNCKNIHHYIKKVFDTFGQTYHKPQLSEMSRHNLFW